MAKDRAAARTTADKRTLGVTRGNERPLATLVEAGAFSSELDAARFAMAHAIDRGVTKGTTEGTSTKWNVGTFDGDGSLRLLVEAIYGETAEPYRLVEHLMNEGLQLLDPDGTPPDVVGIIAQSEAARGGTGRGTADDAAQQG